MKHGYTKYDAREAIVSKHNNRTKEVSGFDSDNTLSYDRSSTKYHQEREEKLCNGESASLQVAKSLRNKSEREVKDPKMRPSLWKPKRIRRRDKNIMGNQ